MRYLAAKLQNLWTRLHRDEILIEMQLKSHIPKLLPLNQHTIRGTWMMNPTIPLIVEYQRQLKGELLSMDHRCL